MLRDGTVRLTAREYEIVKPMLKRAAASGLRDDQPPYPAHWDEGVWYCDAHGSYQCRKCEPR